MTTSGSRHRPLPVRGRPDLDRIEPLLVAHPKARKMIDVGNTKYWELVKKGIIEVRQVGDSTMAVVASLKRLAGAE
jgi:hypothetical protein